MKKFYKFLMPLAIASLFIIINGCSKDDDDNGDGPPEYETLSTTTAEMIDARIPEGLKNSTDENAQECVSRIELATNWSSFSDNLAPPSDAQKIAIKSGDNWVYKWTWAYDPSHTFTMYWNYEETSTKYIWEWGLQLDNGPIYDFMTAWEYKDGSQGEIRYNYEWFCYYGEEEFEDCNDLYWIYTWNTDSEGIITFTWTYETAEEFDYYLKIELISYPDGSGTLDYYLAGEPYYHFEWDALGNGSWVLYIGDMEYTGSWTV
jgi:hypothetical protein